MAAQNQHYVPRFILRQFLSDADKEQVFVYDKHEDKIFVTAIKNIMAERSFHDFTTEDFTVSFEPIASKLEERVLPHYREIIESRRLKRTDEERAALSYLVAFQFVRTKAHRHFGDALEDAIRVRVEAMGGRMEDMEGWEERTEDLSKREHLGKIVESVDEFASLIATKDFLLAEAAEKRSFYLGDNPVCLYNARQFGPYGNLGLALPGIEIYMPLSADLLFMAWCPSNIPNLIKKADEAKVQYQQDMLAKVLSGQITANQMKSVLDATAPEFEKAKAFSAKQREGLPMLSSDENMDHFNSIQSSFAYRYVVAKDANFEIARRHNRAFPKFRKGNRPTVD